MRSLACPALTMGLKFSSKGGRAPGYDRLANYSKCDIGDDKAYRGIRPECRWIMVGECLYAAWEAISHTSPEHSTVIAMKTLAAITYYKTFRGSSPIPKLY